MGAPDLTELAASFQGRLLTDAADTAPFLVDWRGRYSGLALAVAQPDTTEDVAAVVRWCAAQRVPIVPQGGNTGLSGGGTPDASGTALLLSLARLNRVRAVDPVNNSLTVEAGCVLANVQQAARDAGRLFPLSLGAQGSCTIGGNLATNAGGTQVLRYGNSRELCLGLEVVTASGEIWNGLRALRKDNTGYDLRDLYIGSEGTLGVITAATLKLFPLPAAQMTAFAAVSSPDDALRLLALAQQQLGAALTAFELISDFCIELVERHFPELRRPLAGHSPYYVLLESSDSDGEAQATERFEGLLGEALAGEDAPGRPTAAPCITDAVLASSLAQARSLWAIREHITMAQMAEGKNIKHDISVPISSIPAFLEQVDAELERRFPGVRVVNFGHLGDGNLHYNVSPPDWGTAGHPPTDLQALQPDINRVVHDAVIEFNGSISAEHGLGQLRRDEAARYKSPVEMALMRSVKQALDPLGIMNPGKVLG